MDKISEPSQSVTPHCGPGEQTSVVVVIKAPITWTEQMTLVPCREVDYVNPFQFKERTKERGKAWEEVAVNLRKHGYGVSKRAVRDKYRQVKEAIKKKNARELRESGIAPELTDQELEVTQIVEELQEVEKETKELQGEQQAEEAKKQQDGVEMRQRALETFTETNKRIKAEEEGPSRKRRNTGGDATKFLMKKLEIDREMREREFDLKMDESGRKHQEDNRRQEKEDREEERRRQEEERRREREEREDRRQRDEERRQRDEERRREKEERDEERRRREEAEKERRFELLQQQILQQNQTMMMMMKKLNQD